VRLRTKQPPEKFLGGSIILMGFLVAPRLPFMAPLVVIDGNGRRGRDAGKDGFRIGRGREACREGEIGEASGDETIGRFVLIASDMADSVGSERTRVDRHESAKESGDI